MAAASHCLRPPMSPCPLLPASLSLSLSLSAPPASRRLRRVRPPFASWRPSPLARPPSPAPTVPKKCASGTNHEAAEEEGGAVVDEDAEAEQQLDGEYVSSVGTNFSLPACLRAAQGGDPLFFLLAAVAVTTCVAFTGMVVVAIPTMLAMRRAANSFSMLADTALEELPSTMAAVRLSGLEISDLTLELSDLSHEIADGVNKSAKVAQAVEASIGQMQNIARQQAKSMIEERANLRTIPTVGQDKESHKSSRRY